jgi:hypothetical protein
VRILAAIALALALTGQPVSAAPERPGEPRRDAVVGARLTAPVGDQVKLRVGARHAVSLIRLPGNVAVLSADPHCRRRAEFGDSSYRCTGGLATFEIRVRKAHGDAGQVRTTDSRGRTTASAAITITGTGGPDLRLPHLSIPHLPVPRPGYLLVGVLLLAVGATGLILLRRRGT